MLADLGSYPEYKSADIPWVDTIPAHWEVRRLRHLTELRVSSVDKHVREDEVPVRICNYVDVYRNDRITASVPFMRGTARLEESRRFRLRVGDVIVTKDSEAWNDIGVPALVEYEAEDLVCGYHLAILRPNRSRIIGDYLWRCLQCRELSAQLHVEANGVTRYGLTHGALKGVLVPVPPLDEQVAMVRFLDYMDRRIRRYIRAKQRQIALLNELKQAIIHRAVTRGLDPNAHLKPSGVEWLGEIPEHWGVWRIGYLGVVGNGSTPLRSNLAYWSGGTYPWLNSSSVHAGNVMHAAQFVTETALRECHLPRVPAGSVLVAITGQGKTRGTAAVLSIEATVSQHLAFITPRGSPEAVKAEYLRLVLCAAYSELRRISEGSGSTKGALTCEDLRRFRIPLPPVAEQRSLVDWSLDATADIEKGLQGAAREIDLIKDYRTRLIADVVTGKLDVREVAARLPEEADEVDEAEEFGPADAEELLSEAEERLADTASEPMPEEVPV